MRELGLVGLWLLRCLPCALFGGESQVLLALGLQGHCRGGASAGPCPSVGLPLAGVLLLASLLAPPGEGYLALGSPSWWVPWAMWRSGFLTLLLAGGLCGIPITRLIQWHDRTCHTHAHTTPLLLVGAFCGLGRGGIHGGVEGGGGGVNFSRAVLVSLAPHLCPSLFSPLFCLCTLLTPLLPLPSPVTLLNLIPVECVLHFAICLTHQGAPVLHAAVDF